MLSLSWKSFEPASNLFNIVPLLSRIHQHKGIRTVFVTETVDDATVVFDALAVFNLIRVVWTMLICLQLTDNGIFFALARFARLCVSSLSRFCRPYCEYSVTVSVDVEYSVNTLVESAASVMVKVVVA